MTAKFALFYIYTRHKAACENQVEVETQICVSTPFSQFALRWIWKQTFMLPTTQKMLEKGAGK